MLLFSLASHEFGFRVFMQHGIGKREALQWGEVESDTGFNEDEMMKY